ncbi:hypothetical protein HF086_005069 [Spodoptera exigua]|uniref:Uncharacterized protein n=1 Tax=Spodoptera exigua TaxID=7107 RepID=A0A922MH71_SPOEX|nr:hypothetical protein HF086_005069 [Spodoptera exigua]
MSLILCIAGFVIILTIYHLLWKDPAPILGIYSVPGKWYYVKYVLFGILYYVRKAFDAVFFISANSEKDKGVYVIAGCERRPLGMCNGLFYIGVTSEKGLLCSKKIPDTVLFGAEIGEFGAEGIKIIPVTPMVKWTISYKGQMWYDSGFLYQPKVPKRSKQDGGSGFLRRMECDLQFGSLKCKFKIENESFEYTLPSFRDHSFGQKRDWTLMHRYAFHHIFLENGSNISVGVVCQPSTASILELGQIALPNGEVLPIKWVDLKLYQHGESGTAPRDYAFTFAAGDEEYTVQVLVEYESIHYVSSDWDARMVERFCKFVVNNIPGRGVSEFHYRHKDGRPESVAKDDPEWYRKMCHKI